MDDYFYTLKFKLFMWGIMNLIVITGLIPTESFLPILPALITAFLANIALLFGSILPGLLYDFLETGMQEIDNSIDQ